MQASTSSTRHSESEACYYLPQAMTRALIMQPATQGCAARLCARQLTLAMRDVGRGTVCVDDVGYEMRRSLLSNDTNSYHFN